ncbi:hypothetical protein DPMN_006192 [Dreissena polymorpha]|uniref:Uncharacterized protein n=1 Tax=Dreissena polymorpha TaxID=45954 RepID=A0A9D4MRI7_DREPO|nr:hypothetical protein DPMN_006192 [Dreissena polymorpha]
MIGQKLKTALPTGGHVFQQIGTTFKLNQDIIKTNILTNFELVGDFIGTKLLTKFHEDGTRNQMLTDRRTKTGHKSSPEQSGELKIYSKLLQVNDIIGSSTESTPDSESYEIVNKSDRESSGEEQEGSPLETLGSKTREEENNDDETKNDAEKEEEGDCIEEVLLDDISKPSEVDTTVRKRLVKAEDTVDS